MSILDSAIFLRGYWQERYFFHGRRPVAWKMFMYYHDKVIALKVTQGLAR